MRGTYDVPTLIDVGKLNFCAGFALRRLQLPFLLGEREISESVGVDEQAAEGPRYGGKGGLGGAHQLGSSLPDVHAFFVRNRNCEPGILSERPAASRTLVQFHREMDFGYCRPVTISTDNITEANEYRSGVGAR